MNSDIEIAGDPLAVPHLLRPAAVHPTTVAGFAGLARAIAADRDGWAPLVRYDATTRWYHRLRVGPGYEVWLLSWVPGQGSGRHDHGRSSGLLTVLEGELTEHACAAARTSGVATAHRADDLSPAPPAAHAACGAQVTPRTAQQFEAAQGLLTPRSAWRAQAAALKSPAPEKTQPTRRIHTTRKLGPAAQRVFAPGYVHEVVNDSLRPAVSLHMYFPGLTEMAMHTARCADAGHVPSVRDVVTG